MHFRDKEDEVFRRILQAGQGYSDADNQAPLFLRTTDEMLEEFAYLGEDTAYKVVVENQDLFRIGWKTFSSIPDGTFPPFIEGAEEDIKICPFRRLFRL